MQNYAKDFIVKELKEKLDTDLDIRNLYFRPFNTVGLDSVYINDRDGQRILLAQNIAASIDLYELMKKNIVVSTAKFSDFDLHLSKQSADSALNIQFIIDAFAPKDDKPKSQIDFKISAININGGNLSYDILDKERKENIFDVNHIEISDFNTRLALKSLKSDSLNIQIRKFGLKEKSGFNIVNLTGRLITKDKYWAIKGFELFLPDSKLSVAKLNLEVPQKGATTDSIHRHEENDIKVDFELSKSYIDPKDITAFVPQFSNLQNKIWLEANISGYQHNLKLSDLIVTFGEKFHLRANAEVIDWFDGGNTYLLASVDELTMSGNDIEKIANGFSKKKVDIPLGILEQDAITFQGDISGYLDQLTAFGALDTDDGIVRTDMLIGFNKKDKVFSYARGNLYMTDFELGELLQNQDLGKTSLNVSVDLKKPLYKEIEGAIKGEVHEFFYKDYTYKNVVLDVLYANKRVDGVLNINDENGVVSIDGMLDVANKSKPKLQVKAHVNDVQLGKLNLVEGMDNSYLSLNVDANFEGANIDNAQGYILVDSLEFFKDQDIFELENFALETSGYSEDSTRKIAISSDYINGYVFGKSTIADLAHSFKYTLHHYVPALFPSYNELSESVNDFNFHFDIANTEKVSDIFNLPVTFYEPAVIEGFYKKTEDKFKLEVNTPSVKAGGMKIALGSILVENLGESINSTIKLQVEGKNRIQNDITIKSDLANNKIATSLYLINNSKDRAEGSLKFLTEFDYINEEKGLMTKVNIDESQLLLNNKNWNLQKSLITIEKDLIAVDNFGLYTEDGKQALKVDGKYSKYDPSYILKSQLKDVDLSYVFETLAIDALKFGGAATGNIFLSTIEEKPYLNTRLNVADFKFNGTKLGQLDLFGELDDETQKVLMNGTIVSEESKKTEVDGFIDPINQKLSIHFDADSVDIGFLHAYAESIFDKVSGRGTGKVHLHGDFSNVTVEGVAHIEDGKVGIKFLNTDYTFTDTVYLREGLIYFNDIAFKDQYGNIAMGSGKVAHNYFQNIMYHIEFNAKNFLVYNATESLNPIFYGKVFGTGKGVLGGDEQEVNIDINMQTNENTLVRMNFMEDEISEYSFVTYVEPTQTESLGKAKDLKPIKSDSEMNINMNFYIDATPDATVELVMDPVGGDILRGAGSGALQFIWSTKLEPQLFGTYNVNRGSYNFTFQRIMEKKFSIQDGSTVQFRGDPFEALLDVNAAYKLTASLSDLDNSLVEQVGQTSIPVHCILNLTGQLQRPNVKLDINFPTANEDVARQIKSLIDTEDMINKQVVYLLLLSKFYTPDMGRVDHPSSDFTVLASATLSNQLTKIISQIDDRWQLGTHIRWSDTDMEHSTKEVELLLSSQLLNDRLLINGNFGYRESPYMNQESVITDIDIEYLLNSAGTWRIKAYNHFNEKYYYLQDSRNTQTQGIGLVYRKDFDTLKELFPWRRRYKIQPKDSLQTVYPTVLQKGSSLSDFVQIRKK